MEGVLIRHRTVEVNDISMHVAETGPEVGSKGTVLFLHGFPELWYSWHHQMEHLAARGYRCVAPDLHYRKMMGCRASYLCRALTHGKDSFAV
jgi:dienelactone hydrolase